MTAYQINHAGHLVYKNNSVVYQNVDFGFLCLISFLCDLRRLPATDNPRWIDTPKISSHAFLVRLMSLRRVLFYLKLFRLLYNLEVAAQSE